MVSSSYQDIEMVIRGKTLMVRVNTRFSQIQNMITEHEDGKFSCQICGYESQARINVTLHIGFVHGNLSCNFCADYCLGNCIVREHEEIIRDHDTEPLQGQGDINTSTTTQFISVAL